MHCVALYYIVRSEGFNRNTIPRYLPSHFSLLLLNTSDFLALVVDIFIVVDIFVVDVFVVVDEVFAVVVAGKDAIAALVKDVEKGALVVGVAMMARVLEVVLSDVDLWSC